MPILRDLKAKDPRVRVLSLTRPGGQSAALCAGFRAARGELVATLDADLQNDPADLAKLLAAIEAGADVANGVRQNRDESRLRLISSRIANRVRNAVTHEEVSDVGCSLRVMRARYLREVKLYRGMHRFLPTLLRLEGARVVELPVRHRARRFGRSKYGIGNRLWVGLLDLLAVRWMQARQLDSEVAEL